jgi:CelD/BcsL family acetyltransferase involved in cellulose biosynthesis
MTELAGWQGEWTRLARASGNVFATWEWAVTWWRHFGAGRELAIRRDGDVLIPLYVWRERPLRVLRLIGHGPADELGPVCAVESRPAAATALRRAVEEDGCELFIGDDLAAAFDWPGRTLGQTTSPVAHLAGSWEDYLAARSPNLRQQVRRRERNLARRSALRFRLATRETLDGDLTTLFRLHRARWGQTPWFGPLEPFHRDFAALAHDRGWLRLWTLELDGTPVASWLGYRFGGADSYYQAGRDPAFDRDAVGFVLLAHTIRDAVSEGMREYRFLRGDEPFKLRFADADASVVSVGWARGLRGRAALAVRRLRRALA